MVSFKRKVSVDCEMESLPAICHSDKGNIFLVAELTILSKLSTDCYLCGLGADNRVSQKPISQMLYKIIWIL